MWLLLFIVIYLVVVLIGERGNVNRVFERVSEPFEKIGEFVSNWANLIKTSFDRKEDFLRTVRVHAESKDWDVNLPLAMASIEVNWGKSCYHYNLFNVTTRSTDPNLFFKYPTIPDLKFRKYNSFADSVNGFWNLINNTSIYPDAFALRHNASQCITHLIDRGYAGSMRDPARYLNALYTIQGMVF